MAKTSIRIPNYLLASLLIYCVASFLHFAHNAEFLADYPNLPVWFTRSKVYLAWAAVTAVGVLGLIFLKLGFRRFGLFLIMGYAVLGSAGLDHYWVAPVSAHTFGMNATIWLEVATAGVLFVASLAMLFSTSRRAGPQG